MWKALRVGFMLAFQHFHICFPIPLGKVKLVHPKH